MLSRFCSLLIILFPFVGSSSNASEQKNDQLMSMSLAELLNVSVYVASGLKQSASSAPATVSVVTEPQWRAMGARNLVDVMKTIPGIYIGMSKNTFGSNVYNIRGLQQGFNAPLLILIDGIPLRANSGGSSIFNFRKSLAGIQQIEVIRGTGSALYGADSYSGVINLVTKQGDQSGSTAGLNFGSHALTEGWVEANFEWQNIAVNLALDWQKSDHDNRKVEQDQQSILDAIFGTQASLAPGFIDNNYNSQDVLLNASTDNWQFQFWHFRNDSGVGPGAAQALDPKGYVKNELTSMTMQFDVAENLPGKSTFLAAFQNEDMINFYNLFPAGAVLPIGADGNLDFATPLIMTQFTEGYIGKPGLNIVNYRIELTNHSNPFPEHTLRLQVGAEYRDIDLVEFKNFGPSILDGTQSIVNGQLTDVNNTPAIYGRDTKEHFVFISLQEEWQVNDSLTALLGVRMDDYEAFGTTTNPRFSLNWQATDKLHTKLVFGSAYRAPTPNERYFRNNPVAIGNQHLRPETIKSWEWSAAYQWRDNLHTNITLFDYQAKNFIEYVLEPQSGNSVAQNIGQQDGRGLEAELYWQVASNIRLEANYTAMQLKDQQGQDIPEVAKKLAYMALNWSFTDEWLVHVSVKHIAGRERAVTDLRPALEDNTVMNVHLSKKHLFPDTELALKVTNLLNHQGRQPSTGAIVDDYPIAGRQFTLMLRYAF